MHFKTVLVALGIVSVGPIGTVGAQGAKTQWDGVYTDAQAKRGSAAYAKSCASCHGEDMAGGGFAPGLIGGTFAANWNDTTLDELVVRILDTMPQDSPGTLTRAQTVDMVAFMLQKNGAPAGKVALAPAAASLKQIKFSIKKPAAAKK